MVRFESHTWTSALQERLSREAQAAGLELLDGGEEIIAAPSRQGDDQLTFGPYGTSPVSGLHFENVDDAVAS